MQHHFHSEQWIPFPVDAVFAFFANPANLPPLMPAWQKARIDKMILVPPIANDAPPAQQQFAGTGSRMTISFRPFPLSPIRLHWDAVILDFQMNRSFCDKQEPRGPFLYWRHCHTVRRELQGEIEGTRVTDDLDYEVPLTAFGDVANKLLVRRQIRSIFDYRQKRLPLLLSGSAPL